MANKTKQNKNKFFKTKIQSKIVFHTPVVCIPWTKLPKLDSLHFISLILAFHGYVKTLHWL